MRGAAGVLLVILGALGWPWWAAAVGALFILVAVFNVCLLAPVFGGPFSGHELAR